MQRTEDEWKSVILVHQSSQPHPTYWQTSHALVPVGVGAAGHSRGLSRGFAQSVLSSGTQMISCATWFQNGEESVP